MLKNRIIAGLASVCFGGVVFGSLFSAGALRGKVGATANGDTSREDAAILEAPLNPRFVDYLNALKRGETFRQVTTSGHGMGLIPEPQDFSHLKSQHVLFTDQAIPSSYDLRTLGRVTPVKNQGSCNDCWAFATYGSMESNLEPAETLFFSEN